MKCKHENADHLKAGELWRDHPTAYLGVYLAQCEQFRCLDCGAWLSLGPSNENDERVKVEIRAAEIAALPTANVQAYMLGAISIRELDGYRDDELLRPDDAAFHAGYLARAIATHEDSHE